MQNYYINSYKRGADMSILEDSQFHLFKKYIQSLENIDKTTLMDEKFFIEQDIHKNLSIYYAPFEYVNRDAKVMIVGITPGMVQMKESIETVHRLMNEELQDEEILRQVKNRASFKGVMRRNLVNMLDEIELHRMLQLSSTIELFDKASYLVHNTSIIRYPVFYKGENYNGSTPSMLKNNMLRNYILHQFTTELAELNNPFIIPLGRKVEEVVKYLASQNLINEKQILKGFPHPSGGNGWRIRQFNMEKENMERQIKHYFQVDKSQLST